MFDMFHGGKPDPMTLMVVEYEERRSDLERVARYIKHNYSRGDVIDVDEIADECRVYNLTDAEVDYIENRLRKGW